MTAVRTDDPLREAQDALARAGVASPRHDAQALAAHLLGISRSALAVRAAVGGDLGLDLEAFDRLVARRAAREPLQHLLGTAPFRRLELAVGPGVFVPRPETEAVVDWALARLTPGALVVDLCAGTGAIALAVATERPGLRVHAVEREPEAFAWLARNTAATGADVALHRADAADALHALDGTVDLVLSNPPYLCDGAAAGLEPEVRDHDPRAALFGGSDGLEVIRVVVRSAHRLLGPGGLVAVEHGDEQGSVGPAVLEAAGFLDVADHADLAGRPRFMVGRRR